MSFEKEFPSLKKYLGDERVICITLKEVQKYCLDKAKVKEAIDLYEGHLEHELPRPDCLFNYLDDVKKELGLGGQE